MLHSILSFVIGSGFLQPQVDQAIQKFGGSLSLKEVRTTKDERLDVYIYEQSFLYQGRVVPVEYGSLKITVQRGLHNGINHPVVLSSPRLVALPENMKHGRRIISEARAIQFAQRHPGYDFLTDWSAKPNLVIARGEGGRTLFAPALVWKVRATGVEFSSALPLSGEKVEGGTAPQPQFAGLAFYVDGISGKVLQVQDEVHHVDVEGKIEGFVTPGLDAGTASNPPMLLPLEGMRVTATGPGTQQSVWSDSSGTFVFSNISALASQVTADLVGQWASIIDVGGPILTPQTLMLNLNEPPLFVFNQNPQPTEFGTAQLNAFNWVKRSHDYIRRYIPTGLPDLDTPLPTTVNMDQACNAYYYARSIYFFREKDYSPTFRCANSAFSNIIVHEYGHNVVQNLNLGQNAFGEGYADSLALLLQDDPVMGRGFYIGRSPVRDYTTTRVNFPCQGEIHHCGMVLGGVWWEMRNQFVAKYGSVLGLEKIRQLHMDWSLVTQGGLLFNAAHPDTAVEVLTVDDDDANLSNGTPHFDQICAGFLSRGIRCPEPSAYTIELAINSKSQVELLRPGVTNRVSASILPLPDHLSPERVDFWYRLNDGAWTVITAQSTGSNSYFVDLPSMNCLDEVDYFFRAIENAYSAQTFFKRTQPYKAIVAGQKIDVAENSFENSTESQGWWSEPPALWSMRTRASDDYIWQDFFGQTMAWYTGTVVADSFVPHSGSLVSLYSPVYSVPVSDAVLVSYVSANGPNPNYMGTNSLLASYSRDGGVTWRNFEVLHDTADVLWLEREHLVLPTSTPSDSIAIRMRHSTPYIDYPSESGFDDLKISAIVCAEACPADLNADQAVDVDDLLLFLSGFENGAVLADINEDSAVDVDDLLDYIAAFSNGC